MSSLMDSEPSATSCVQIDLPSFRIGSLFQFTGFMGLAATGPATKGALSIPCPGGGGGAPFPPIPGGGGGGGPFPAIPGGGGGGGPLRVGPPGGGGGGGPFRLVGPPGGGGGLSVFCRWDGEPISALVTLSRGRLRLDPIGLEAIVVDRARSRHSASPVDR